MIGALKRTLWWVPLSRPYTEAEGDGRMVADEEHANCYSSLLPDGRQAPLLDLDCPHVYVPSSTAGHGHLVIDKPMSRELWERLMTVLGEVGILEEGYVGAAIRRGHSELRIAPKSEDATKPDPTPVDNEPPY